MNNKSFHEEIVQIEIEIWKNMIYNCIKCVMLQNKEERIQSFLEIIDMAELLPEGEYLKICDLLKNLSV
jgi:hypothetical protein